jgi:hypothetical protein
MASIIELYKANQKTSGVEADKIAIDKATSLTKQTPYSEDASKNADLKVLDAAKLKSGYALGELGGGWSKGSGYSDAKGKTYSEQVKY